MDLQGHVFYVFVVGGEDAQDDIIRVPGEGRKSKTDAQSLYNFIAEQCARC